MPDSIPPLFNVEKGLADDIEEMKIVFEKYIQTRMGNAEANRLYENGDYYEIYLSSNQSIKKDNIFWRKVGVISPSGIDKIKNISNNSLVNYINKGPYKMVSMATENVNWYFYFDQAKFTKTQLRQWRWWQTPKFANKINKVLDK